MTYVVVLPALIYMLSVGRVTSNYHGTVPHVYGDSNCYHGLYG